MPDQVTEPIQNASQDLSLDPKSTPPIKKNEAGQWVLKNKDQEEAVDEAKLVQLAQMGYGANKKFEETAQTRKQLREDLVKADQGDVEAYARVLDMMELNDETKAEKLETYVSVWEEAYRRQAAEEEVEEPEVPARPAEGRRRMPEPVRENTEPQKLSMEQLPESVQALVNTLGSQEAQQLLSRLATEVREKDRGRVYDETWGDVAKDEFLAKIVTKGGPRAEKLRSLAQDLIRGRIQGGDRYTPDTRASVVKQLRELAENFGVGSETTPIPGLGTGAGINFLEAQAEKAPERVSVTDPKWSENLTKRLAHEFVRNAAG